MRLDRDQMTPRDLMRWAWFMSMFWAVAGVGAVIHNRDDDWRLYLLLVNLWVMAMFLARYLQRTIR
jgi:hypothetical protein